MTIKRSEIQRVAEAQMARIWEIEGLTREQKRWAAFGIYELWRALDPARACQSSLGTMMQEEAV